MELKRKIFPILAEWKKEGFKKCLLIEGARQTGKTYSVRRFGKSYSCFIEINFTLNPELRTIFSEDMDAETILRRIAKRTEKRIIPGDTLIFLDEIQDCPRARASMKSLSQCKDVNVIASGSLLGVNYKDVPSHPVGYEQKITMESLDFEEFLWAMGLSPETIESVRGKINRRYEFDEYELGLFEKYFSWYTITGGMPEAVCELCDSRDFDKVLGILKDICIDYRNDAGKYSGPLERNRIFACFDSIPVQLAKETNRFLYSDITENETVRSSKREYSDAIQWLKDAGIIIVCPRVGDTKVPMVKNENLFKIYTRDQGILMSMVSRGTAMSIIDGDIPSNLGYLTENCIASLLVKTGIEFMYYRRKTTEVEFIFEIDGIGFAMDSKSGNSTRTKSLDSLLERSMIGRGIKLRRGNIETKDNGVECYPLFVAGFVDSLVERKSFKAED